MSRLDHLLRFMIPLAAGTVAAARLAAQAPAERAAIERLRDSLAASATPEAVAAIAPEWRSRAPAGLRHLREGFVALRRGQLGGARGDLDDAVMHFEEAAARERDWPYPWLGLALAALELHAGEFVVKESRYRDPGASNYAFFTRSVTRAFERDSLFPPAVRLVTDQLAAQGDRGQPAELLAALRRASRQPGADPRALLVLGRAERAGGRLDSALADFGRFLAAGGDAGTARLEQARTLRGLERTRDALSTYREGLRHPTAETRAIYRLDLAWIATPGELRAYDALPPDSLVPWVNRFWSRRDAEELRAPGERLAEHLRRWLYVHEHYRIAAPERRTHFARVRGNPLGPCTEGDALLDDLEFDDPTRLSDVRRKERLLDDRARIYMRHGEPARRVFSRRELAPEGAGTSGGAAAELPPPDLGDLPGAPDVGPRGVEQDESIRDFETWIYWFEGRPRFFHFRGSPALGKDAPTTLFADVPMLPVVLEALAGFDPDYHRLANQLRLPSRAAPTACAMAARRIARRGRVDMTVAVTTDSYTPIFERALEARVQVYAVGAPRESASRLLVVFAVPGRALTAEERADGGAGVAYRLALRVTAVDSARGLVRRLDTTRTFASRALGAGEYVTGLLELPVPPGRYTARVAIREPAGGAGTATMGTDAAHVALRDSLWLTDLVLGRSGSGLTWHDGATTVELNPLEEFPAGGTAELYYGLGGLVPGRTYATTLTLSAGRDGRGRRALSLRFVDGAGGTSLAVQRSLGLASLRPGAYRLTVTVEETGTGRRVTRERDLLVAGP